MSPSTDLNDVLDVVAKILLRCFAFGFLLLLVWLASLLVAGDWAYQVHSRLFDLSEHDFDVMNYYGLACTKMCTFLFFLGP
ncbi:MAG: DUF6868 family protein, partial [Planctomycetota bacterium]